MQGNQKCGHRESYTTRPATGGERRLRCPGWQCQAVPGRGQGWASLPYHTASSAAFSPASTARLASPLRYTSRWVALAPPGASTTTVSSSCEVEGAGEGGSGRGVRGELGES